MMLKFPRLKHDLLALRRYLPRPVQQLLKPVYWWWREQAFRLQLKRVRAWQNTLNQNGPGPDEETRLPAQPGRASLIIVSYHNLDYLRLCLASIWANTRGSDYEVLVVDNASGPEVVEYLKSEQRLRKNLAVIFNDENFGFAKANNIGLAATQDSDYVVLLNNDTVVTAGWLERLLAPLRADRALGMIGPVTNWASTQAQLAVKYRTLTEMDSFAAAYTCRQAGHRFDVSTLPMFCVALRRAVVDQIGPLDETFGLGLFEDDDYALRLRRAGYRLVVTRDVFIHHWGGAAFGRLSHADYEKNFEANRVRFETKWGEPWRRPPLNVNLFRSPYE